MLETVSTAKMAQLSFAASLQERAEKAPGRVASLGLVWERNLTLDSYFYDVKVVTDDEIRALADHTAAEGSILVVGPKAPLKVYPTIQAFADAGDKVRALSIAGVGSSALGAAALARNVATAIEAPVAAVVSGYGYSDLAAEALGGWFWFGSVNRLRHGFEVLDRMMAPPPPPEIALERMVVTTPAETPLARVSVDTNATLQLLGDPQFDFDLLVGHSKGNLVISEALYALGAAKPERLKSVGAKARIVTISARIAMPSQCATVVDVIGTADPLGELNSTPGIPTDIPIPGAGHHTNTEAFGHLDVTDAVKRALKFKP